MSIVPKFSSQDNPPKNRRLRRIFAALWIVTAIWCVRSGTALGADRLILRDTRVINDRVVVGFDEDGVRLDGTKVPTRLGWEDIAAAQVKLEPQRFAVLHKALGDPLFRIQQRLKTGDYRDLAPHAQALYPRFQFRRSATAVLVSQSLLWSDVALGRREQAILPYLTLLSCRKTLTPVPKIPGPRVSGFQESTGLCSELIPIWLDEEQARIVWPQAKAMVSKSPLPNPNPIGVSVYLGTLALAAGDREGALTYEKILLADPSPIAQSYAQILKIQREFMDHDKGPSPAGAALSVSSSQWTDPSARIAAHYWLGRTGAEMQTSPNLRHHGVVHLLHLPALLGPDQPDLAAAGLFHAATTMENLKIPGAAAIRNELIIHYPETYHGKRQTQSSPAATATPDTKSSPNPAKPVAPVKPPSPATETQPPS